MSISLLSSLYLKFGCLKITFCAISAHLLANLTGNIFVSLEHFKFTVRIKKIRYNVPFLLGYNYFYIYEHMVFVLITAMYVITETFHHKQNVAHGQF